MPSIIMYSVCLLFDSDLNSNSYLISFLLQQLFLLNKTFLTMANSSLLQQTLASFVYHEDPDYTQTTQSQPICRICYETLSESQLHMYCQCKAALAHVHPNCLLEWSKRVKLHKQQHQTYFHCEICKEKIFIIIEEKCQRNSLIEFKAVLSEKTTYLIILLIFFSLSLALIIAITSSLPSFDTTKDTNQYVLLTLLIFSALIFISCSLSFVKIFLIKYDSQIIGIHKYCPIVRKGTRIMPLE